MEVCPSVPSSSRDSPYRYPQPRSGELPNLVPTSFLILLPRPTPSGALSPPPPTLHHTLVALTPPTHTHPPLLLPTSLDLSPCLLSPALGPRSASLLSLQTELLLDLVAEAQSRRLEEQRATFHPPKNPLSLGRALPRPLEDREQLYSTILSHQVRQSPPLPAEGKIQASWFWPLFSLGSYRSFSPGIFPLARSYSPYPHITGVLYAPHTSPGSFQGLLLLKPHHQPPLPPLLQCQRMEAQRSEPPLPPGGQELLELLLRVQGGGRMEEQRSRPPTHTC